MSLLLLVPLAYGLLLGFVVSSWPTTFWYTTFTLQVLYILLYAPTVFFIIAGLYVRGGRDGRGLRDVSANDLFPVSAREPKRQVLGCFSVLGLGFAASIGTNLLLLLLETSGVPVASWDASLKAPADEWQWAGYFFMSVCVPAFFEELVFRGAFLGILKKINTPAAVVLTALLFGLFHGTLEQIPFTFVFGLGLGWLCVRFDNLPLCMAVHFLNNGVAFLQARLCAVDETFGATVTGLVIRALLGLGLFSLVMLCVKKAFWRRVDTDENGVRTADGKTALLGVLSSPFFWVTVAVFVGETLLHNAMYT